MIDNNYFKLTALILASCVSTHCAAEPIIWFKLSQPPAIISEGPEQGHGYTDQRVALVLHNLPQYQVTISQMPPIREIQMMKAGGPYCSADLLETAERESFLRFTVPAGYVLPIGLVVRAKDKKHYDHYADNNHMISLEGLMRVDSGVLGVGVRRTYGEALDRVIAKVLAAKPGKIQQVYGENTMETLFKMLAAHHINALLAFPVEEVYLSEQLASGERYYTYPIVESQKLVPVRFSCTRQASTDALFADLEIQAKSTVLRRGTQLGYERWLPPYLLPMYRARLNEVRAAGG